MTLHRLSFVAPGAVVGTRPGPLVGLRPGTAAPAVPPLRPAFARYGAGVRGRTSRRLLLLGMAGLHVLAIVGLLDVGGVRDSVIEAAPIFLAVLPAPQPAAPARPLPPPAARLPTPPVLALPLIAPEPLAAPAPLLAQATPRPAPMPPAPEAATPAPPALAAPAPRTLPAAAVQYLVPPSPVYSRMSARMKESGKVVVRVFIDEQGLPRDVQVGQSAGFARLDEAALAAVRKTRFKPCIENGVAVSGWAFIPIEFELER